MPAAAADSVTGEVVDLACYMVHPQSSVGAGHKKCAEVCLKKGLPAGLLTADKQLYLLLEDHDNSKPYAAVREKGSSSQSSSRFWPGCEAMPLLMRYWMRGWSTRFTNGSAPIA